MMLMRMIKATKLINQPLDDQGCSSPTASELVEELLVELLVALLAPHGQEDVAADELVDHLAVRREALQQEGVSWVQGFKEDLLTWKITFLSSSNWIIMCRVSQFTFHAWYWVNQIFNSTLGKPSKTF